MDAGRDKTTILSWALSTRERNTMPWVVHGTYASNGSGAAAEYDFVELIYWQNIAKNLRSSTQK